MAKHFDPRKVLKQVSNQLLEEFFTRHNLLRDVPWKELTETDIEPVFDAWQRLPDAQRKEVQVILQDVNELADERGLSVMAEEVQKWCPHRMPEFTGWVGRCDKAMWVYLNMPNAFEEVALFARADALAAGRYWITRNSLPRQPLQVDAQMKQALAAALTGFYKPSQGRGHWCHVEHYQRANGAEYFFAYLDDYPDRHLVFEDSGEMKPRADRYAFINVFVYSPTDGGLDLYAQGGKKVHGPLQELFCKATLGIDIGPADPDQAAYQLDGLKDPGFPLPTDPADRVAEARIRRLRLELVDAPRQRITLDADLNAGKDDIHRMIQQYLNSQNVPLARLRVTLVTFRLTFMHNGDGWRPKTLTFDVSYPNSCDLKSRTDEMRAVGERCLKLWRITHE